MEEVVESLRAVQPLPTRHLSYGEAASGLQQLQEAEFVYMHSGGVVPPLSPLYRGPYQVLERSQTFLSLEAKKGQIVTMIYVVSLCLAPLTNRYTSVYACVLFHLASL